MQAQGEFSYFTLLSVILREIYKEKPEKQVEHISLMYSSLVPQLENYVNIQITEIFCKTGTTE